MILRSVTKQVSDQNWFAVFLDLFIVISGILIGVQVNEWLANQSEYKRETVYFEALNADFKEIVEDIEYGISNYESTANSMSLLIKQSLLDEPSVTLEKLNKSIVDLTTMQGTPITSDTYTNLIDSGDLSIIKISIIKKHLSGFIDSAEVIVMVGKTHEMQLVNIFQPYIIENLDYASMIGMENLQKNEIT